jgi:hypothetical protein
MIVKVMDSRPEIMPWEASSLRTWRRASVIAYNHATYTTAMMEDFLLLGGKTYFSCFLAFHSC